MCTISSKAPFFFAIALLQYIFRSNSVCLVSVTYKTEPATRAHATQYATQHVTEDATCAYTLRTFRLPYRW